MVPLLQKHPQQNTLAYDTSSHNYGMYSFKSHTMNYDNVEDAAEV